MSTEATGARLVKSASVEPLYPASRLLTRSAQAVEGLFERARACVGQAEAQAKQIRALAEEDAARIRAAAEVDAETVRREAKTRGLAQAGEDVAGLLGRLDAEVGAARTRVAEEVQRVAFRFARAILDVEFVVRPDRIATLVSRVLERAARYREVRVHLHPEDAPFVRTEAEKLAENLPFASTLMVIEDSDLPRHGVRVETEMGSFWGGIDDQLGPLRDHLGLDDEGDGEGRSEP